MTQGDFFNCFSVILQRQALRVLSSALLLGGGFLFHSIDSVAQTQSTLRMVIGQQAGAQIDVLDRKSTRLNSSHSQQSRMPSSA